MRIGIYGGTFDPIHLGHLVMASLAKAELDLDEVWLIPAFRPPHKDTGMHHPASAYFHRLSMTRLAVQERSGLKVSDLEGQRDTPSYTYETLVELHRTAPQHSWIFLCGADSLASIHSWYHAKELVNSFEIGVFQRPGFDVKEIVHSLQKTGLNQNLIKWLDTPMLDISSTWLRERLKRGKEVADLIPASVQRYIKENRLYEEV